MIDKLRKILLLLSLVVVVVLLALSAYLNEQAVKTSVAPQGTALPPQSSTKPPLTLATPPQSAERPPAPQQDLDLSLPKDFVEKQALPEGSLTESPQRLPPLFSPQSENESWSVRGEASIKEDGEGEKFKERFEGGTIYLEKKID